MATYKVGTKVKNAYTDKVATIVALVPISYLVKNEFGSVKKEDTLYILDTGESWKESDLLNFWYPFEGTKK